MLQHSRFYVVFLTAFLVILLDGSWSAKLPTPSTQEASLSQPSIPAASLKTETRKSEKKELSNKKTVATTPPDENAVIYRLNSEDGSTCILIKVDAIISFNYVTKLNQQQEADLFVPDTAIVTGDCSGEDKQTMILKWKSFVLKFNFDKTPGGERWFVEEIELKYDPTDKIFEHIKDPARTYTLSSRGSSHQYQQLLFLTPVGKSYWCDREIDIKLDNKKATDTTATLLLRDLKLEPFIFKNDEFGPEYKCSAIGMGSFRSETAPLVVGSLLAATCLLTVAGYSGYRYFKIKKVEYNTMD